VPKVLLDIADKRMQLLPDILMSIGKIRLRQEFLDTIGKARQNITTQHFTPNQIQKACLKYGVNANWVLGISKTVFNKPIDNQKLVDLSDLLKKVNQVQTSISNNHVKRSVKNAGK
jgi:hypothetical protein